MKPNPLFILIIAGSHIVPVGEKAHHRCCQCNRSAGNQTDVANHQIRLTTSLEVFEWLGGYSARFQASTVFIVSCLLGTEVIEGAS